MWLAHLGNIPPFILSHYGSALAGLNWVPVTSGFSGADVWCGENANGTPAFALKRWPSQTTTVRLAQIHAWMGQVTHLPYVPTVLRTVEGDTVVQDEDRVWDVTTWLPGVPHALAGKAEVENACKAVAELHAVWSQHSQRSPCPGVLRRIEVLTQWLSNPDLSIAVLQPGLTGLLSQALAVVERTAPFILQALRPWETVPLLLHPCIRDLRGEHVLYVGEHVAGIVDFGAMDVDSPAIDLARMLGDLVGENEQLLAVGLNKYRQFKSDFDVGDGFIRLLDRAGMVCSIVGWFARLSKNQLQISTESVKNRLSHLIARAELCKSF
jgi:hypothetical protein